MDILRFQKKWSGFQITRKPRLQRPPWDLPKNDFDLDLDLSRRQARIRPPLRAKLDPFFEKLMLKREEQISSDPHDFLPHILKWHIVPGIIVHLWHLILGLHGDGSRLMENLVEVEVEVDASKLRSRFKHWKRCLESTEFSLPAAESGLKLIVLRLCRHLRKVHC